MLRFITFYVYLQFSVRYACKRGIFSIDTMATLQAEGRYGENTRNFYRKMFEEINCMHYLQSG